MTVHIRRVLNIWCLSFESDMQVHKVLTFSRYIDAELAAQALQVHVDSGKVA